MIQLFYKETNEEGFVEIPLGNDSEIFIAEYGFTSYNEMLAASQAGKFIIAINGQRDYIGVPVSEDGGFVFLVNFGSTQYRWSCNSGTNWSETVYKPAMANSLVDNSSTASVSIQLQPGKTYRYLRSAGVTSLTITLANPSDSTVENEYVIEFISGSTPTTLNPPSGFKWLNGEALTPEANKHYRIVFLKPNNLAIWSAFA